MSAQSPYLEFILRFLRPCGLSLGSVCGTVTPDCALGLSGNADLPIGASWLCSWVFTLTSRRDVLEGAPSFANCAKGGFLRSNAQAFRSPGFAFRFILLFSPPYPNLSSRPERPDFLFRAELGRVGPRNGGICFPLFSANSASSVNSVLPSLLAFLFSYLCVVLFFLFAFLNFQL